MRTTFPHVAVALIAALSLILISWGTDNFPSFHQHSADDYYTITPKGQQKLDLSLCWVATGNKTALIFGTDYKQEWMDPRRLFSTRLTIPAKVTKSNSLMTISGGRFISGSAVTFENANQIQPTAKGVPIGLLFIAYQKDNNIRRTIFAAAPFDANGRRTADFSILKVVDTNEFDIQITKTHIFARVQDGTVAVTLSTTATDTTWPAGTVWSKAFFVETGLDGKAKYAPKLVKLPNNGAYMDFELLVPTWYKSRWVVPGRAVIHKKLTPANNVDTEPTGSSLYVMTVKPKANKAPAMKLFTVETDDQANKNCAFAGVQFLPTAYSSVSPSALTLKKLYLVYLKRTFIPKESADPRIYSTELYVRETKKTGKTKSARKIDFEKPESDHSVGVSKKYIASEEYISKAFVDDSGRILLSFSNYNETVVGVSPSNVDVDGSHALYSFNEAMNALALIYSQFCCYDCWLEYEYFADCIWFGGWWGYMYVAYEYGEDYAKALVVKMKMLGDL